MLSIPGTEALSPAVKYVMAFAIIFVLLALFALVLRRLTGGRLSLPAQGGRTRQPRLGIVDVYDLDRQRQLILLRRDNVEHLLLIGGPNDVVVETNIVRTPGARMPAAQVDQNDRPEALIEQRPEPVVARLGSADPTRAGMEQPVRHGPVGVQAEPFLKPDVVALSPAATPMSPRHPQQHPQLVREAPPPQPIAQRATPAKAPPREAPQVSPPEAPVIRAVPEQAPRHSPQAPPASRSPDPAMGDAAVLSNMAKQLEEALKRPVPAGRPGPAPVPNGPAPQAEDRQPRATPAPVGRTPQPVPAAARPSEAVEPAARPRPAPAPAPAPRVRPVPEPEPVNLKPAAAPQPGPSGGAANDPFSVEEIEAEFARLLGRPADRGDRPH